MRIDALVNNAAGNFASPTERLSHRAVDAVLNIVLHGTFYCTLELGKRWIAAGRGGRMLNIVTSLCLDWLGLRCAVGGGEGRRPGADPFVSGGVGALWHHDECDCARAPSPPRERWSGCCLIRGWPRPR